MLESELLRNAITVSDWRTYLVKHIEQSSFIGYHFPNAVAHVAFDADLTTLGQPPQDMERIGINVSRARRDARVVAAERGRERDGEKLEAPAVTQTQAHDIGEAVQNIMVRRNSQRDVLDERAIALVESRQRVRAALDAEDELVLRV